MPDKLTHNEVAQTSGVTTTLHYSFPFSYFQTKLFDRRKVKRGPI